MQPSVVQMMHSLLVILQYFSSFVVSVHQQYNYYVVILIGSIVGFTVYS